MILLNSVSLSFAAVTGDDVLVAAIYPMTFQIAQNQHQLITNSGTNSSGSFFIENRYGETIVIDLLSD
jgi:hypothetical protein